MAIVGRGLDEVILVLSLLGWPLTGGFVRAQFLSGDGLNDALSPRLQRRV